MTIKLVVFIVTLILVFAGLMCIAGPIPVIIGALIGYFWEDIFNQMKKVGKYVTRKD